MKKIELSPVLKQFVQVGFDVANSQFKERKEVLPQTTLLAENEEGTVIVPILCAMGLSDKSILTTMIQGIWGKLLGEHPSLRLIAISVLVDTWIEKVPAGEVIKRVVEGSFVPPSQKPESVETILVQLTLPGEVLMFQWPYVRVGETVMFVGEPEENKEMTAVFPGLWPV